MFGISNKIEKLKARFLGKSKTSGYQSSGVGGWGTQYRQLPYLSFHMIDQMLWDSTCIIGLAMREAPISDAELAYKDGQDYVYGVKADNDEVGAFVIRQIERFWANDLHKVMQDQVYGWMAAEVVYRLVKGEIEYDTMLARNARDVRALESNGDYWGVRFANVRNSSVVDLQAGESFWHGFRAKNGGYYGQTILKGAYPSWCDKNLDGGALDVRRLYMHKDAYGGGVLYYPNAFMEITGKGSVPCRDVAREILEQVKAGGVMTMPSSYTIDGKREWELAWRDTGPVPTHIFEFPKDLDREQLRGMEIPDEILISGGAGSWEGKKVPLTAFYTQENIWGNSILSAFDKQVLRPLVLLRFGKAVDFDAQLKPFSIQLAENENKEEGGGQQPPEGGGQQPPGGGGGGGGFGGGGMPPQALSLDYMAELAATETVGQAERIVAAAQRAVEKHGRVTTLAVARAPEGGVNIDGTEYVGGEFIPGKTQEEVDEAAGGTKKEGNENAKPANSKISEWAAKRFKNPAHAKAFTEWFGDSKVVDENGEPLVVYHGTGDTIKEFDLDHKNRGDAGWLGTGVYMTSSTSLAESYANMKSGNPNILPLYVKIENPYYATRDDKNRLQEIEYEQGREAARKAADEWTNDLKLKGHDGVILKLKPGAFDNGKSVQEVVSFNTSSVKSATGNQGTFDPSNPKITMSLDATGHEHKGKGEGGGQFTKGGGGGVKKSDAERDTAAVNVPLAKRGNIDAQIDKYKKEQATEKKQKRISDAATNKKLKAKAKELFGEYAKALAERTSKSKGVKVGDALKAIDSLVKWEPEKAIWMLENFSREQKEAKTSDKPFITLYHETPSKNISNITTEGLKSNNYNPRWFTVTDSLDGAKDYSGGSDDRHIVEIHLTKEEFEKHLWKHPGASEHYGNQYALKSALPSSAVKAIHKPSRDGTLAREEVDGGGANQ